MLDTTPDPTGPRAIVKELTDARTEQRWLTQRLLLASSDDERDKIRALMSEQSLVVHELERQRKHAADTPAFERR
jgi:hypothetical protein